MERGSLSRPGFGRIGRRNLAERCLQWRSHPVYDCVAAAEFCWWLDTVEISAAVEVGDQHGYWPGQRARARSAVGACVTRHLHAAAGPQSHRIQQCDLPAKIKPDRFRRVSLLVDLRLR